ncbi:MAG: WYL domain-containing protein [Treponema sp.]|nr:WYL domain-containing protein [Treponema sp.]
MKTEKKPPRKSVPLPALERLYVIDREIASKKYPNTNDLVECLKQAEAFGECKGVSIATVSRDLEFMRDRLKAPIEYDAYERGYYYTEKTFRLPGVFASADDFVALGMAKSILSLYRGTPFYNAANHLLDTIMTPMTGSPAISGKANKNQDWLENRIVVPKIASAKVDPIVWEIVVGGLKRNRVIIFDYRGTWDAEYRKRQVRPYQLLFDSGVWYLYGFAEERKATRIFSLSRIANAKLADNAFTLPANFRYADFTGDSYFGVFIGQEKRRYAVDCYGEAVIFATERQWAANQKITEIGDDGIRIEFTSTQYDKVLKWVLSCGCNAVPREPEKLVGDWKDHVKEMAKLVRKRLAT